MESHVVFKKVSFVILFPCLFCLTGFSFRSPVNSVGVWDEETRERWRSEGDTSDFPGEGQCLAVLGCVCVSVCVISVFIMLVQADRTSSLSNAILFSCPSVFQSLHENNPNRAGLQYVTVFTMQH